MAFERRLFAVPGLLAGEDFSSTGGLLGYGGNTGQFLFVKMKLGANDLSVVHCNGQDDIPIGIAQGNSKSGDALEVMSEGVSKVKVGASNLKAGDEVGSDSSGRAVKITPTATGANFGSFVRGVMLQDATAGDIGTVLLDRCYRV